METDHSTVGGADPEDGSPPGSSADDAPDPHRRRAMIASVVVVAVLVLVVAIGGSILAYRALSPEPGAAESAAESAIIERSEILGAVGGTMHGPHADAAARRTADPDRPSRTLDPLVATNDLAPSTTKDNTL